MPSSLITSCPGDTITRPQFTKLYNNLERPAQHSTYVVGRKSFSFTAILKWYRKE